MEEVRLELVVLDDAVALALHVELAGTPVRCFSSPLSRPAFTASAQPASQRGSLLNETMNEEQANSAAQWAGAFTQTCSGGSSGGSPSSTERAAGAPPHAAAASSAAAPPQREPLPHAHQPTLAATLAMEERGAHAVPQSCTDKVMEVQPAALMPTPADDPQTPAVSGPSSSAQQAVSSIAGGGGSQAATLETVMSLLQQLLAGQAQRSTQQHPGSSAAVQQAEPAPVSPSTRVVSLEASGAGALTAPAGPEGGSGAAAGVSTSGLLPDGVQKLLALEVEVVQLQQSLQIAQLEFETRTVQLHSLKQRADEADQRAQAAEERASSLAQQVHALERQAGELRCQLREAEARHQQQHAEEAARHQQQLMQDQQEQTRLAAAVSAATAKQQAAEADASALQQQLASQRQATEQAQSDARRAAAQQGEWQEKAAVLRHENQQLKVHITAACGALKALGIPLHKVFSRAALALTGHGAAGSGMQSPPDSPAECTSKSHSPAAAAPLVRPPQVPRLQLSSISLEQLQQQQQMIQLQQRQQQAIQEQPAVRPAPTARQEPQQPALPAAAEQHASAASLQQQPVQRLSSADMFKHVMVAADGTAALGYQPPASPAETSASSPGPVPASSRRPPLLAVPATVEGAAAGAVSAARDALPPALLTARRAVSPAQQELLSAAQQWQLTARSVQSAAAAAEEEQALISAYRPHQRQQVSAAAAAAPISARRPPVTARAAGAHLTPRVRQGGAASATATPSGKLARHTYGLEPGFQEIKQAYQAVVESEADKTRSWARSVFSSSSAVETDPRKVEPVVQGLLQLFQDNGVRIPLIKCGPCQFRLGTAKLSVRLVNGRLVARAGAGQTMDVLAWLEKQPVQH